MLDYVRTFPQVQIAMGGEEATSTYDLPLDREGHFVVISQKNAVIGSREEEHDLSNLGEHRLRSHGGLSEQDIPLVMSRPVRDAAAAEGRQWRNYDAFELALNW
jgi:phosphonoacetate hydrolase